MGTQEHRSEDVAAKGWALQKQYVRPLRTA